MPPKTDRNVRFSPKRRKSMLVLVAIGVALLALLVLIQQKRWFKLRPATGTAAAMSLASDRQAQPAQPARQ